MLRYTVYITYSTWVAHFTASFSISIILIFCTWICFYIFVPTKIHWNQNMKRGCHIVKLVFILSHFKVICVVFIPTCTVHTKMKCPIKKEGNLVYWIYRICQCFSISVRKLKKGKFKINFAITFFFVRPQTKFNHQVWMGLLENLFD